MLMMVLYSKAFSGGLLDIQQITVSNLSLSLSLSSWKHKSCFLVNLFASSVKYVNVNPAVGWCALLPWKKKVTHARNCSEARPLFQKDFLIGIVEGYGREGDGFLLTCLLVKFFWGELFCVCEFLAAFFSFVGTSFLSGFEFIKLMLSNWEYGRK